MMIVTVLIAEDDPVLRKISGTVLNEFGHTAIEAADGEEAVVRFLERKGEIHLIILDAIMPKKDGREVYEDLRKARPVLKALFMSGYTADNIKSKGILADGVPLLSKPIIPDQLLRKVREVLDA